LLPLAVVALLLAASWQASPRTRRARGSERLAPGVAAEVVVLDVGHGLSVLLRAADGTDVLVDAGGLGTDVAERRILPALRALGVTELTALVVSHEDFDHCGDAARVIDALPTRELIVAHGFGTRPPAARLLATCARQGVPVTRAGRGAHIGRGGVTLRVLHPEPGTPGPIGNEQSLVVHATCAGTPDLTVMLPGDVQWGALAALALDRTLPHAEVLLLPHHGQADLELLAALAQRCRARVLIASGSTPAPLLGARPGATTGGSTEASTTAEHAVAGASTFATGRDGAVRVRSGRPAECWPFDPGAP
jgi:competence protein ComEC